jgi:hypothetical protein
MTLVNSFKDCSNWAVFFYFRDMSKAYYITPAIITLIITIPIALFSWYFQNVNFWQSWIPGVAGTYEEFCERNRMDELIREPSNTFSNLAYVWLGLQVISFAIWD